MAANPCIPGRERLESNIMGFLHSHSIKVEDYLLEMNTNNQQLCPPNLGRTSETEPFSSRSGKENASSKRQRATQRRRYRMNEKLKALQLLIPNSKKTDKASILEDAIQYIKQLQLQHQLQMLSSPNKMNLSNTCMPKKIPCSAMPQMCMNISLGTGTNMTPWQWNNGIITVPRGVQGPTIPPWVNEQKKGFYQKISELNNESEAENGSTSQPRCP